MVPSLHHSFREGVVQPTNHTRPLSGQLVQSPSRPRSIVPKHPHVLIIHVRTLYFVDDEDSFSRLLVANPLLTPTLVNNLYVLKLMVN